LFNGRLEISIILIPIAQKIRTFQALVNMQKAWNKVICFEYFFQYLRRRRIDLEMLFLKAEVFVV
jgi:hypothetical protein